MAKKVEPKSIEEVTAASEGEAPVAAPVGAVKVEKSVKKDKEVLVELTLPFPVKINGEVFEGKVSVPQHLAETIIPMVHSKMRTDAEIFVGKSYLSQKLADGRLVVKES